MTVCLPASATVSLYVSVSAWMLRPLGSMSRSGPSGASVASLGRSGMRTLVSFAEGASFSGRKGALQAAMHWVCPWGSLGFQSFQACAGQD